MIIELKKFGTTLTSRQTGSEAYKALQPTLRELKENESIEVEFDGVFTFAPSWGDEFLTPLLNMYGDRLILRPSENLSVHATIKLLEEINQRKFKIKQEEGV